MSPVKELSGLFMSSERWDAALASLQQPSSDVAHVRLFHNTALHVTDLLRALESASSSTSSVPRTLVTRLFIGDLDLVAAQALAAFLASPSCTLRVLELQHLGGSCDTNTGSGSAAAAAGALAPGLRAAAALAELQLQRCQDEAALATLAAALAARPPVASCSMQLGLQHCRIGTNAANALGSLAAAGATPTLSLSNCQLSDPNLQTLLSVIHQPLIAGLTAQSLQHLNLGCNAIGPDGAAALAILLPLAPRLTTLVLEGNTALKNEGVAALAGRVHLAPALTHLDLSDCGVGAAGAAALAAALGAGAAVQRLMLGRNAITADGLVSLTAAARLGRCALRELGAESCSIGGARLAAAAAAAGLPAASASPLQALRLGGNALGDDGVAWVVQMLLGGCRGPSSLRELEMRGVDVGDAGAEHVITLMAASPHLQSLLLDRNSLQDRGAARLCAAAEQHPGLTCFSAKESRHMGMAMRARVTEVAGLVARRGSPLPLGTTPAQGPRDAGVQELRTAVSAVANAWAEAGGGRACQQRPACDGMVLAVACSAELTATGAPACAEAMEFSCSGVMEGLHSRCSSSGDGDPAGAWRRKEEGSAACVPHAGAAAKHRLELDQQELHAAKHHHHHMQGGNEAPQQGDGVGSGAAVADDAAWLPRSWQSACSASTRATAAGQQGKTFTGCSVTSLGGGSAPTSPSSACAASHCVAYVTAASGGKGVGAASGHPAADPPSQRGSAEGSDAGGVRRSSGGAASPGRCSRPGAYSRRFRPLSEQQQLLFADF